MKVPVQLWQDFVGPVGGHRLDVGLEDQDQGQALEGHQDAEEAVDAPPGHEEERVGVGVTHDETTFKLLLLPLS